MRELFSNEDDIKGLDETYKGEYSGMIIKEIYELYPKVKYPMITIEELDNEDVSRYYDGKEEVSFLSYQINITCEANEFYTANENVRRVANIIDKFMKGRTYKCMRRISTPQPKPLGSDNNVMIGYLRYECYLEIDTNTIYRRY